MKLKMKQTMKKVIALVCVATLFAGSGLFGFAVKKVQAAETLDPNFITLTGDDYEYVKSGQTMTLETADPTGCYMSGCGGALHRRGPESATSYLNNTVLDVDITFSEHSNIKMFYGHKAWMASQGIVLVTKIEDGNRFIEVRDLDDVTVGTITEENAGTQLLGKKFHLQLSVQLLEDDIKLGVWINGTLYQDQYFVMEGMASRLNNYFNFMAYEAGSTVTMSEHVEEKEPEVLDSTLTKLTLEDFAGMGYGTYTGTSSYDHKASGIYNSSLDGTVCSMDVEAHTEGVQFRYGGKGAQDGLQFMFWGDDQFSVVADTWGVSREEFAYHISASDAGVGETFYNNKFNLKISMQYVGVDANSDGILDDLKLGVWFNDVLYNNEYMIIANGTQYVGGYFDVIATGAGYSITFSPVESDSNDEPSETLETLDPTLTKLTPEDFTGMGYDTYTGTGYGDHKASGFYTGSLDGTVCDMDVTIHATGLELRYGGKGAQDGLQLMVWGDDPEYLTVVADTWGIDRADFTYQITASDTGVGDTFTNNKFDLKVSMQYVGEDANGDGILDDLKLGLWFNNKLCQNKYIVIPNGTQYVGGYFDVICNEGASVTLGTTADVTGTIQPTITDSIALDFDFTLNETLRGTITPYMSFTVNGNTVDNVEATESSAENGRYTFTYPEIMAQDMENEITATIHLGGVTDTYTTSVWKYCETILNGDFSEDTKDLVVNLVQYGAAVEAYRSETETLKTLLTPGHLLNDLRTDEDYTIADFVSKEDMIQGTGTDYVWKGATLVLDNKVMPRYYFTMSGTVEPVVKDSANKEYTVAYDEEYEMYYVDIDEISAKQYDTEFTLTFEGTDHSCTYSVNTYLNNMRDYSGAGSANLKPLLVAINNFGLAAEAYQGQ